MVRKKFRKPRARLYTVRPGASVRVPTRANGSARADPITDAAKATLTVCTSGSTMRGR
jgi:hypothetical protein